MALVDNTDANESASQVTGAGGSVANDIISYHIMSCMHQMMLLFLSSQRPILLAGEPEIHSMSFFTMKLCCLIESSSRTMF
jgi:hypothetical protein